MSFLIYFPVLLKHKMAKRKLITAVEAVENILRFVQEDEEVGPDNGDLGELYGDDDIEAAAAESDSDRDVVSDDDTDEPVLNPDNQRPPAKLLTRVRLVNSIKKSLDPNCMKNITLARLMMKVKVKL